MVNRVIGRVAQLAVMAVPLVGWFGGNWSGATTLVMYWAETVMTCTLVFARASLHQRWSPRRGHFRYAAPGVNPGGARGASFVGGYLMVSTTFCAAHAVFLGALLLLMLRTDRAGFEAVSWSDVGLGCISVLGSLAVGFAADLVALSSWSFGQVETLASQTLIRVAVIQFTVILGFFAVAVTGVSHAVFSVFVVLKALTSLSWAVPQRAPAAPPPWLNRVMNRVPRVRLGERFEESWARDQTNERMRRDMNERPWQ